VEAIKIIRTIVRATKEMIKGKKIEVLMIGRVDTETKEEVNKKDTIRADKEDIRTGTIKEVIRTGTTKIGEEAGAETTVHRKKDRKTTTKSAITTEAI